jgi:glutaredoxin-like YruB-family protein
MNVTIYTTPTCGFCYQAKQFLTQRGVPFVEKNVAADQQAAMEMVRLSGQQGVPVINIDGQVVVGFDQPRLMQLLSQPQPGGARAKPKLGATIADAASQAKKHPGIPARGAYVGRVRAGSAAHRAGLRPGDVITALGGQPVYQADDVQRLLEQLPQGRELSLTYVRDGQQRNTLVRV